MKTPEQIADDFALTAYATAHGCAEADVEDGDPGLAGVGRIIAAAIEADRAQRAAPPEHAWYTCVDCNSGDMVEDAARWHESHEGHVVKELDDEEEQD